MSTNSTSRMFTMPLPNFNAVHHCSATLAFRLEIRIKRIRVKTIHPEEDPGEDDSSEDQCKDDSTGEDPNEEDYFRASV